MPNCKYANYKKAWYEVVILGNRIERFNVKYFRSKNTMSFAIL